MRGDPFGEMHPEEPIRSRHGRDCVQFAQRTFFRVAELTNPVNDPRPSGHHRDHGFGACTSRAADRVAIAVWSRARESNWKVFLTLAGGLNRTCSLPRMLRGTHAQA